MAEIKIPAKIAEIFAPPKMRYRVAWGGRGSGKTRSFALMAAVRAAQLASQGKSGKIICARELVNSLSDSTFFAVCGAINQFPELASRFSIGREFIRTKDERIEFVFSGLRYNVESVKSKEEVHLLWVDEAEAVSERAWQVALPTIRPDDSEIWVSWNPRYEHDATEQRWRIKPPIEGYIGCEVQWYDNPFFPDVLDLERRNNLARNPEFYPHIWEGKYITVQEGAYWTAGLGAAEREGRISAPVRDPLLPIKCFFDLGGASGRADATAIWSCQFVGERINVLEYYEAVGQPLAAHAEYLRKWGNPELHLPHDGRNISGSSTMSWQTALYDAGFNTVEVHRNLGAGAALLRIEAVRRIMCRCVFNAGSCKGGLLALAAYHEKRDPNRNIGLGPEHDWSSHGADSFGLMATVWEENRSDISESGFFTNESIYESGGGDICAY